MRHGFDKGGRRQVTIKNDNDMANFLTGVLTGVAIGLLTAPRSGKETREKLTEAVNKQTGGLKEQWEKTVSQAKETLENVKSQAGGLANQAQGKFDQYKNDAESTYQQEKLKGQYNDKVDDVADNAKSGVNEVEEAFKID